MENDVATELAELDRLALQARRASLANPSWSLYVFMALDISFFGVFALTGWRLPLWGIAGWWVVTGLALASLRLGRRAKPRHKWQTAEGRRDLALWLGVLVAINAIFVSLWFFNRGVAMGVLLAVIGLEEIPSARRRIRP